MGMVGALPVWNRAEIVANSTFQPMVHNRGTSQMAIPTANLIVLSKLCKSVAVMALEPPPL